MCSLQWREHREDKMSFAFRSVDTCVATMNASVWQAALSEKLKCVREAGNCSDLFAVLVVRAGELNRNISSISLAGESGPRHYSSVCSMFLRNGGEMYAR